MEGVLKGPLPIVSAQAKRGLLSFSLTTRNGGFKFSHRHQAHKVREIWASGLGLEPSFGLKTVFEEARPFCFSMSSHGYIRCCCGPHTRRGKACKTADAPPVLRKWFIWLLKSTLYFNEPIAIFTPHSATAETRRPAFFPAYQPQHLQKRQRSRAATSALPFMAARTRQNHTLNHTKFMGHSCLVFLQPHHSSFL